MVSITLPALLAACSSLTGGGEEPAVLALDADDDLSVVAQALSEAEGRTQLSFGPSDPRKQPMISVLPPRPSSFETRSPALPSIYDIATEDGKCVLTRRVDGYRVVLGPAIPCAPYKP